MDQAGKHEPAATKRIVGRSVLAKGIRVNQLAKELGVDSKGILEKLRAEGLGEKHPNHMSVLPLGLAESVREWFAHAGGGTAVETAPAVEVLTATKLRTSRKKKTATVEDGGDDHATDGQSTDTDVAVAEPKPVAKSK
ncbi:MAG: translation initiation factor IF-2 N-terminal domain-containing protein, partial [Tepidisphaeraceae bacterium]